MSTLEFVKGNNIQEANFTKITLPHNLACFLPKVTSVGSPVVASTVSFLDNSEANSPIVSGLLLLLFSLPDVNPTLLLLLLFRPTRRGVRGIKSEVMRFVIVVVVVVGDIANEVPSLEGGVKASVDSSKLGPGMGDTVAELMLGDAVVI